MLPPPPPSKTALTSLEIFSCRKTVLEITENSKKFVSLYNTLCNTFVTPQLDALTEYMRSRVNA